MFNKLYIFLAISHFAITIRGQDTSDLTCDRFGRVHLKERSWEAMLQGEWLVGFCVPLFPECHQFERTWTKFAVDMLVESNITVASMTLDYSETLIQRFSLRELPTILHAKDGKFRVLPVSYVVSELKDLVLSGALANSDPIPFYMDPSGWVISLCVFYYQTIDWVYENIGIEYEHAGWLIRILSMVITSLIITSICVIYSVIWLGPKVLRQSEHSSMDMDNKFHPPNLRNVAKSVQVNL